MNGSCDDCGGFDIEWMYHCVKHPGVEYCRGCACPLCAEDGEYDERDYPDDGDYHQYIWNEL